MILFALLLHPFFLWICFVYSCVSCLLVLEDARSNWNIQKLVWLLIKTEKAFPNEQKMKASIVDLLLHILYTIWITTIDMNYHSVWTKEKRKQFSICEFACFRTHTFIHSFIYINPFCSFPFTLHHTILAYECIKLKWK